MYGNLIFSVFISLLILINGKQDNEKDLLRVKTQSPRLAKSSFDAQFHRGRCPDRFYQVGEECLYFATNGKQYSWDQAQNICAQQIPRLIGRLKASFVTGQPHLKPTKGVRQLILNTPEKTKILEAFYRDYDELNFIVRLPSDYNTLNRCHDEKDDNWPQYCTQEASNGTCFETNGLDSNDICLRQIECNQHDSRLACEYTIPGSSEVTASKFRHCPKVRGLRQRFSVWAWVLVAVGAMLLLLLILGGVLAFNRNSNKETPRTKSSLSEPRRSNEQVPSVRASFQLPSAEPMLVRPAPANVSTTDHHEPQPLKRVVPPTIPTTTSVRQDDTTLNF